MRTTTRFGQSLALAMALTAALPAMAQQARKVAPEELSHDWSLLNRDVAVDVSNSGVHLYKPSCPAVPS